MGRKLWLWLVGWLVVVVAVAVAVAVAVVVAAVAAVAVTRITINTLLIIIHYHSTSDNIKEGNYSKQYLHKQYSNIKYDTNTRQQIKI
jgi:hypothetical protein